MCWGFVWGLGFEACLVHQLALATPLSFLSETLAHPRTCGSHLCYPQSTGLVPALTNPPPSPANHGHQKYRVYCDPLSYFHCPQLLTILNLILSYLILLVW